MEVKETSKNEKKEKEDSSLATESSILKKVLSQRSEENKEKRKSPIKDLKKMIESYRRVFGPDKYPTSTESSTK